MYTVKEDNLEEITYDDNGAYLNSRNVKTHFLVVELDETLRAKCTNLMMVILSTKGRVKVMFSIGGRRKRLLDRALLQVKRVDPKLTYNGLVVLNGLAVPRRCVINKLLNVQ